LRRVDSRFREATQAPAHFGPAHNPRRKKFFPLRGAEMRTRNNRRAFQMRRRGLRIEAHWLREIKLPLTKKI
jgi:hypothetical protein